MKDVSKLKITFKPEWWPDSFLEYNFPDAIPNFISALIENVILFRNPMSGYGQTPRANLRILSAIWTTSITFIGVYLLYNYTLETLSHFDMHLFSKADLSSQVDQEKSNNQPFSIMIGYVTIVGVLFWNERRTLYEKWSYLADLYNKCITTVNSGESNSKNREVLQSSLALDLLDLGMWNHDSFKTVFKNVFVKAFDFYSKNAQNEKIIITKRSLSNGGFQIILSKSLAREIIQKYQHSVMELSDFPDEKQLKNVS